KGKANYLDTDHWFDRVTPKYGVTGAPFESEDFYGLANSTFGVLYDGGKDLTTETFKRAFGVIRQLNREIKDQNERVRGNNNANFQLRAVEKWLALHKESADHVPPDERGFGDNPWKPGNENHRKLLYFLNRYCYRCHSSVKYNVFERQAVKSKVPYIQDR